MDTAALSARLGRAFRQLQVATAVSGIGDGLVVAAFPLLAAQTTDDPRYVVAVTVAARLPWLLVGLPAGALVDRHDRRRLVLAVEAGRTAVLLAFGLLVVADWSVQAGLLLTAFVIGLGETVVDSSFHAVLPRLVAEPSLARANGILLSTETATEQLLGPALGGVLFALAAALPFLIDGASFALAAVLVALAFRGVADTGRAHVAVPLRRDVADGFGFFVRTRVLRLLAGLVVCFAFCQAVVFGPLVLFALDELGLSDAGYGLLLAATAVGNVAGGMWAGRLDRRFGPQVLLPAAGLAAAAGYAVCGTADGWLLAALALAVEAVAVAVGNVASLALRQRVIPNELLGRVGNVFRFFIFGAIPVGALVGGFLVQGIGLRAPFAAAAGLQVLVVVLLAPALARELRRRGSERVDEHRGDAA